MFFVPFVDGLASIAFKPILSLFLKLAAHCKTTEVVSLEGVRAANPRLKSWVYTK